MISASPSLHPLKDQSLRETRYGSQVVIATRWWLSIIPVVLGIFVTIFLFYETVISKREGQSA
jgi:uncharacterized membrane protein YqhA